ncbi:hypothetical protein D4R42_02085 [bacterium]|nr:MAG: hypothetical protein D4R42_02085 [bacterium]
MDAKAEVDVREAEEDLAERVSTEALFAFLIPLEGKVDKWTAFWSTVIGDKTAELRKTLQDRALEQTEAVAQFRALMTGETDMKTKGAKPTSDTDPTVLFSTGRYYAVDAVGSTRRAIQAASAIARIKDAPRAKAAIWDKAKTTSRGRIDTKDGRAATRKLISIIHDAGTDLHLVSSSIQDLTDILTYEGHLAELQSSKAQVTEDYGNLDDALKAATDAREKLRSIQGLSLGSVQDAMETDQATREQEQLRTLTNVGGWIMEGALRKARRRGDTEAIAMIERRRDGVRKRIRALIKEKTGCDILTDKGRKDLAKAIKLNPDVMFSLETQARDAVADSIDEFTSGSKGTERWFRELYSSSMLGPSSIVLNNTWGLSSVGFRRVYRHLGALLAGTKFGKYTGVQTQIRNPGLRNLKNIFVDSTSQVANNRRVFTNMAKLGVAPTTDHTLALVRSELARVTESAAGLTGRKAWMKRAESEAAVRTIQMLSENPAVGSHPEFRSVILSGDTSYDNWQDTDKGRAPAIKGQFGKSVRWARSAMSAGDATNRSMLTYASVWTDSEAKAVSNGYKPGTADFDAEVTRIATSMDVDSWAKAAKNADDLLGTSELGDRDVSAGWAAASGVVRAGLSKLEKTDYAPLRIAGWLLAPYRKTLLNVTYQMYMHSPIGSASTLLKMSHNAYQSARGHSVDTVPERFALVKAERLASLGLNVLGAYAIGALLGGDDDDSILVGSQLSDAQRAAGRTPYSMRIGDLVLDLSALGPTVTGMISSAEILKAAQAGENIPGVVLSQAMSVLDSAPMAQFAASISAMKQIGPDGAAKVAGRIAGQMASGFIPMNGTMSWTADMFMTERELKDEADGLSSVAMKQVLNRTGLGRFLFDEKVSPTGVTWDNSLAKKVSSMAVRTKDRPLSKADKILISNSLQYPDKPVSVGYPKQDKFSSKEAWRAHIIKRGAVVEAALKGNEEASTVRTMFTVAGSLVKQGASDADIKAALEFVRRIHGVKSVAEVRNKYSAFLDGDKKAAAFFGTKSIKEAQKIMLQKTQEAIPLERDRRMYDALKKRLKFEDDMEGRDMLVE